jgi:hypothetical protein
MALPAAAKTALQAKKDKAEIDRVAAVASGNGPVAAWAAREKADADRMAVWHADTLS